LTLPVKKYNPSVSDIYMGQALKARLLLGAPTMEMQDNYRPDSDLHIIYNVGTQFASIAPANPPQVRETRFAVKWTYSFAP
jgi:hypothetical protein